MRCLAQSLFKQELLTLLFYCDDAVQLPYCIGAHLAPSAFSLDGLHHLQLATTAGTPQRHGTCRYAVGGRRLGLGVGVGRLCVCVFGRREEGVPGVWTVGKPCCLSDYSIYCTQYRSMNVGITKAESCML